jgi:hypothetical protein
MGLDAAEAFQAIDHWLVEGQQGDLLDLSAEFLPAREFVLEQTEVLREDDMVFGRELLLRDQKVLTNESVTGRGSRT